MQEKREKCALFSLNHAVMRLRGERGGSEELWFYRVEKWDILVIIKAG
jgi:hypothetical protein